MKTVITGIIVSVFIAMYILYLYNMAAHTCDSRIMKLWNYYILGFIIFSIWVIEANGINTFLQESIITGAKLTILLIFIDIILTNHGVIKNPYSNLLIFMCGSLSAITLLLFQLIKTYGKRWLIIAILFFTTYLYFLLEFVVPLISARPTGR